MKHAKQLDRRALAYASAALWGGGCLIAGAINLSSPAYGLPFFELMASVYPGYVADGTPESVVILTGYALVKGAVGGWLLGTLYNRLVKK